MVRPVDAVIEFLEAEQARGITHLHLDAGARDALRQLYIRSKGGPVAKPAVAVSAVQEPAAPTPSAVAKLPGLVIEGTTRAEQLDSLRRQAETWTPARNLGTLRDIMVFATGNPEARLMLVGEAPGYNEEREREPFVGPAGQKLNDILKAMGIARQDVYISNIVKFRPATPKQSTNNRPPTPEEMAACMPFVREEIRIVQPVCIIALGGTAAKGLLGQPDSVSSLRGSWHEFAGVPVRVTYHPSYLLRSDSDLTAKRQVWEDMMEAMEKLALPISEKQRGFFLPKA